MSMTIFRLRNINTEVCKILRIFYKVVKGFYEMGVGVLSKYLC